MRRPAQISRGYKRDDGYTLTEILVVMAIIGLIAAILTPSLMGQLGRARAKTAQMQLQTIAAAVESYRSDVGHYPATSQGLNVKDVKLLNDPWGHAVQYQPTPDGQSFTVISLGRDGQPGGSGLDRDLSAPTGATPASSSTPLTTQ
jgi:general secretion pathway protein G